MRQRQGKPMLTVRLGLILLSLGVACLCGHLLIQERQGAGAAAAVASLRDDPARWRGEAATLRRYLSDAPLQAGCRGERDRDMLTLALAGVDLAGDTAAGGPFVMRAALERAEAEARHLLSCSPTDGQAWLDHAILTARLQGRPAAAYPGVLLSSWFAPHDAGPLKARVRYALWLAGQSVGEVVPLLHADLVVFLNWGRLSQVKEMLAAEGPRLQPFLSDIPVSGADPARRALVQAARRP
jgi:hypothetical protein